MNVKFTGNNYTQHMCDDNHYELKNFLDEAKDEMWFALDINNATFIMSQKNISDFFAWMEKAKACFEEAAEAHYAGKKPTINCRQKRDACLNLISVAEVTL